VTLMLWEPETMTEPTEDGLSFVVLGDAQPAGSKRAFIPKGWERPVVVDANPKAKTWQQQVASEALMAIPAGRVPLFDGPIMVEFTFYRSRPRGHFRKDGRVRDGAPAFPTTRPDVLKTARGVEDAMSGIVYRDDAQIVDERLRKCWGDPARLEVTVRPLA
jgi:Holliday junction resolvase RusA-like endonuclease